MPTLENSQENPPARAERARRFSRRFRLFVTLPFLLFLVVLITGTQVNYIPSDSMLPNLKPGDRTLTLRPWLAYTFGQMPNRGDIVVFRIDAARLGDDAAQDDALGEVIAGVGKVILIKRVIGLPGDTVQVQEDGKVLVNGSLLQEDYPITPDDPNLGTFYPQAVQAPITVPAGELFVLGDNRATSDDGRFWGTLKRSDIIGRYFVTLYNQPVKGSKE